MDLPISDSAFIDDPNISNNDKPDSFLGIALLSALIASGMAMFLFWQNQSLRIQLAIVTATPAPVASPVNTNPVAVSDLIDCTRNESLDIKLDIPQGWNCKLSLDEPALGTIVLTNSGVTVTISNGGRGPYCGDSGSNSETNCEISTINIDDVHRYSLYRYNGENKEIFGGLGISNNTGNSWVSIEYENMENQDLTATQKQQISLLLSSIISI